jgi:hypothetical protein
VNWRRIAEVLRLRHAVRLMDERAAKAKRLSGLENEAHVIEGRVKAIGNEVQNGNGHA